MFLDMFIYELEDLQLRGLSINNEQFFPKISKIICDAPAKSFILGVKGHTGYHGCTKCMQEGEVIKSRMTFPETSNNPRTDENFQNKVDENYHKVNIHSPFERLNIGLVSQVPLDYMHLVCLGVFKRLLIFWIKGAKDVRMKQIDLEAASADLVNNFRQCVPKEFSPPT
ncbi:hypothetical protein Zmor_006086 [Zophobas morio]|uniref:Uncharacterized protein n=1 Tax=Zophobas morio TaxID=2755281 RepID=A0AA38IVK0_9CUCU|nr:hypothetical protein Zmor_006086 [Zophobas morio]